MAGQEKSRKYILGQLGSAFNKNNKKRFEKKNMLKEALGSSTVTNNQPIFTPEYPHNMPTVVIARWYYQMNSVVVHWECSNY